MLLGVLSRSVVLAIFGAVDRVVVEVSWERWGHGSFLEAWGVGCRLAAKLGEVKVRAGAVPEIHRFVEPTFRIEAVEDNAVDGNCDYLDDDFNKGADERPVLRNVK